MIPESTPLPPALEGAIVFLLGLVIGSFLNVCIYRMPRNRSIVHPGSSCPGCGKEIGWQDNIPVLSWLLLRGRCRRCGTAISPLYPAVELLTGLAFLGTWLQHPSLQVYPFYCLLMAALIAGTFIDFFHYIIPDEITIGGTAAGLIAATLSPAIVGLPDASPWAGLGRSFLGALIGGGGLLLVAVIGTAIFRKEAMGLGDVKLMAAIGAFLGPHAPPFSLVIGSIAGSLVGLVLLLSRKAQRDTAIPFGPYLALGAAIYILWGPQIIRAYLDFALHAR